LRFDDRIIVTADQARNKFDKLEKKYKELRQKMNTSGQGRVDTFVGFQVRKLIIILIIIFNNINFPLNI